MKALVVIVALTWSNLVNVEGNLIEVETPETPRGFFPPPFFPPYQPPYSPIPFNPPPECFRQPVIPEIPQVECPACPVAESCTCEPVLQTCQTYTITVCPSAPPPVVVEEVPVPDLEEIIDAKIVDVTTGQILSEQQDVIDIPPEYVSNPKMFPLGYTPFPGYNQFAGMFPPYGSFPGQFGASQEVVTAVRALEDDKAKGGDKK